MITGRTIQTAGSERIDGALPCKKTDHVWAVAGEYDDPAPDQRCRCGAQLYRTDTPDVGHHAPRAKQYVCILRNGSYCMEEADDGNYVSHADYEALRRQYDATAEGYRARIHALQTRYDALVRHVADRAGVQLPPLIIHVQQREHLAHCPAHPFIAQCICDEVPT